MDALEVVLMGALIGGGPGSQSVIQRISGRTMSEPMQDAFLEIKAKGKPGPASRRWLASMGISMEFGVLESAIQCVEKREKDHAEKMATWRRGFERFERKAAAYGLEPCRADGSAHP
mgnify:CR=1 FL=1